MAAARRVARERSRRVIHDSFETACPGKRPRDYTRLDKEVETAAERLAMRRHMRIGGRGVLLLAASGLINGLPIASQAQEQVAERPHSPGAGSPPPGSLAQGAPVGGALSQARKQEKAAVQKALRFWDREND